MKRLIQGEDRTQFTLFPESLDEYITEDNTVRVIDVFVDEMDLGRLEVKTNLNCLGIVGGSLFRV